MQAEWWHAHGAHRKFLRDDIKDPIYWAQDATSVDIAKACSTIITRIVSKDPAKTCNHLATVFTLDKQCCINITRHHVAQAARMGRPKKYAVRRTPYPMVKLGPKSWVRLSRLIAWLTSESELPENFVIHHDCSSSKSNTKKGNNTMCVNPLHMTISDPQHHRSMHPMKRQWQ